MNARTASSKVNTSMSSDTLSFQTLVGHEWAKTFLKRASSKNTLGHAFLFQGPDGVGKKRTALTLAAYLNCRNRHLSDIDDACGHCHSCKKLQAGNHPDLIHIQPDGTMIKIKQIRELKQALTYPPFEARYRVVILEDIHTMRREAANSMLKTLEEPPDNNILILTAESGGTLLPTIVSRCQKIPFHAIPLSTLTNLLTKDKDIPENRASALAAVSEGSPGRALFLHESGLLDIRKEIVETLIHLDPDAPETLPLFLQLAEKTASLKENLPDLLGLLKIWFRDLLVVINNGADSLTASRDISHTFERAVKRWPEKQLFSNLASIEQAEKALQRNCNRNLVCEVLFFELT
jgi:DNA polymerase-3 subunit delta'